MAFIAQEDEEEQEGQPQGQTAGSATIGSSGGAPVPGQAPRSNIKDLHRFLVYQL